MQAMRPVGLYALGPLRHMKCTSFRILGTAKFATLNSYMRTDLLEGRRVPLLKLGPTQIQLLSHSTHHSGKKSRSYWSAITTGLLGIAGLSFIVICWDQPFFKNLFFTPVACACSSCNNPKPPPVSGNTSFNCGDINCKCRKEECVERRCDSSECLHKTDCEEKIILIANCNLERALRDTKGKAVQYTEDALKDYCAAIVTIKEFMNKVKCASEETILDSPRFEDVWDDVYDTLQRRCDLASSANEKAAVAWQLLIRLREIIENGRCCPHTTDNPLLRTAEETLKCAEKEICSKKSEMEDLLRQAKPVEQYRNLVEEFRRDLKAEVDSLIPHITCKPTFNRHEFHMILAHAYKKILRLQKEISDSKKPPEEDEECQYINMPPPPDWDDCDQ